MRPCSRPLAAWPALLLLLTAACGETTRGATPTDAADASPDTTTDTSPGTDAADASPDTPPDFVWPVPKQPVAIQPSAAWRHTLAAFDDPFLAQAEADGPHKPPRWVKFTVFLADPDKVYFQDSQLYPMHHGFATAHLDPFLGWTPAQFDAVTRLQQGQQAILGAVLFPDGGQPAEFGVQLVRQDAYHPEMVRYVFERVRAAITAPVPLQGFYFPTAEQQASAAEHAAWFAAHGLPVASVARWQKGDACYAQGWALGKLRFVPGAEVEQAWLTGQLGPGDILATDLVPAEVPIVAGLVALQPATPNSHAAILAQDLGLPFVHLAGPAAAAQVQALAGQEVLLRARLVSGQCRPDLFATTGLDAATRQLLLGYKQPAQLEVTPTAPWGKVGAAVDGLTPQADLQHVGGKASHYALLRKALPAHTRPAAALSFDLWHAFLDQKTAAGPTLRAAIQAELGGLTWPMPPAQIAPKLAKVRELIGKGSFTPAQRTAVAAALASLPPAKMLRFRSSTNVEDGASFTGAGLYDSHSGCLADDLDADDAGPSLCDPDRPDERSALKAIRKVYASFYGDRAFVERLRRGVDEAQVGMALLVNPSFPDETELANGVALVQRSFDQGSTEVRLVTQLGATSVTNPEGGALPEVVRGYVLDSGPILSVQSPSSLAPLGGHVMAWPTDYAQLATLLDTLRAAFVTDLGLQAPYMLDVEYKKVEGEGLVLKQARTVPQAASQGMVPPVLIGDSVELCVLQGEAADVFANHRLKARVKVQARPGLVDAAALQKPLWQSVALDYVRDGEVVQLAGEPATFAGAAHEAQSGTVIDSWQVPTAAGTQVWQLVAQVPAELAAQQGPVLAVGDIAFSLQVAHPAPVPTIGWDGQPTTTQQDAVTLVRCPAPVGPKHLPQVRSFAAGGVQIETRYFWPPELEGIQAGYTAPLAAWERTTITLPDGTVAELQGWAAQTYRPEHHNFDEHFLFEPRLEPALSAAVKAKFAAQGIVQLHVLGNTQSGTIRKVAADGTVTQL